MSMSNTQNTQSGWTHRVDFIELDCHGYSLGNVVGTEYHVSRADAIGACLVGVHGTRITRVRIMDDGSEETGR